MTFLRFDDQHLGGGGGVVIRKQKRHCRYRVYVRVSAIGLATLFFHFLFFACII